MQNIIKYSKRKSVEVEFSSDKLGRFIITEYVTRKRVYGTFKIAKAHKFNVFLSNNITRLQGIFIVRKPLKALKKPNKKSPAITTED